MILAEENEWNDRALGDMNIQKFLESKGYEYIIHVGADALYIEKEAVR